MKTRYGRVESQFLAYAQMRGLKTISTGDLSGPMGMGPIQERKLLSRLSKAGLIARVQRGLYLIPPRLPLGGAWNPGEALALNALMQAQAGQYQVCGPNAFYRYGLVGQVPARLYAYNDKVSGLRRVGQVQLTLIKVAPKRLGDVETATLPEGQRIVYSSRTRTLVDAVYDWARFNSLPRAYDWIRVELKKGRVIAPRLVICALQYGDIGTLRRLGLFLERQGAATKLLDKMSARLSETSGPIPWVPTLPRKGAINKRWGVIENAEL